MRSSRLAEDSVARHPNRPHATDYLAQLIDDVVLLRRIGASAKTAPGRLGRSMAARRAIGRKRATTP